MQFTTVVSALAMALVASAAPAEIEARTSGDTSYCTNTGKQVCCTGIVGCIVALFGSACTHDVYCCKSAGDKNIGDLISVDASCTYVHL